MWQNCYFSARWQDITYRQVWLSCTATSVEGPDIGD
jgi:hypothetical protein